MFAFIKFSDPVSLRKSLTVLIVKNAEGTIEMHECETIIQKSLKEGLSSLLIDESQQICNCHHTPTPNFQVTINVDEAVQKAKEIGFPVVMKIISSAHDLDSIIRVLTSVLDLIMMHNTINQLDLNPVIVYPASVCAADSRIIMGKNEGV
jgi:predicted ABC-class ATPase